MKRRAAALLLAVVVPVGIGRQLSPREDGLAVAWARGAAVIGIMWAVAWAAEEVGNPDG